MKDWQGPGREGRLRGKPCTVLVQGKPRRDIDLHNLLAEFPKSAAGTGKQCNEEPTPSPPQRRRYMCLRIASNMAFLSGP